MGGGCERKIKKEPESVFYVQVLVRIYFTFLLVVQG